MQERLGSRRKELTGDVTDSLIRYIRELQPGDRLPSEMELARMEGVSRGTIREAAKILASRNVIEIRRGKGSFVADHPGIADDPWGTEFSKDADQTLLEMLELRYILEPDIAAFAAERAADEDIEEIERLRKETEDLIFRGINHSERDKRFHMAISKATHNSILTTLVKQMFTNQSINYLPEEHRSQLQDMLDFTIEIHRELLEAIRAHDPERARRAMETHIRKLQDRVSSRGGSRRGQDSL